MYRYRTFRRTAVVALLLLIGMVACGDDDRAVTPDYSGGEAESPPETEAPAEASTETAPEQPDGPIVEHDLISTDDAYPAEWLLSMAPGDCTEERLNGQITNYYGCVTLRASETEDEFDGVAGQITDHEHYGLVRLVEEARTIGIPGAIALVFAVVPRPPGYHDAAASDLLSCGPAWCRVGQRWEDVAVNSTVGVQGNWRTEQTADGTLSTDGSFNVADVLYVLMGSTEIEGLIGAIGADGREATAEAQPLADCLISADFYTYETNSRECLGD